MKTCPNFICLKVECRDLVQLHQFNDIEGGKNDIRFNFVITNHGIFEGRGWDIQTEITGPNFEALSFGFITELMTNELLRLAYNLMIDGFLIGKVQAFYAATCEDELCYWQTWQINNLEMNMNFTSSPYRMNKGENGLN